MSEFYNLEKIQGKVFFILKKHPDTRNSDTLLIIKYLRMFHGVFTLNQWGAGVLDGAIRVSAETIRRTRQKIQNEHNLFLPTKPEIRAKRKIEEESWRQWCNTH